MMLRNSVQENRTTTQKRQGIPDGITIGMPLQPNSMLSVPERLHRQFMEAE